MRLVKMGMRLLNKTVLPEPRMPMALFQIKKQITEAPILRYRIEITTSRFQVTGPVVYISQMNIGNMRTVPNKKVVNRKLTGEIAAGFFFTKVL